jgi:hypothetical protein
MHLACFNPFSPIAETTIELCGSNRAHREASPGSVGESEGASVTPSVGAEATAVQSALVETRKQVLVLHALQKAPSPTATFVSIATWWLAQSTLIRTHAQPGRAFQRVASGCAYHFFPFIVSFGKCESSDRSGCRVLPV